MGLAVQNAIFIWKSLDHSIHLLRTTCSFRLMGPHKAHRNRPMNIFRSCTRSLNSQSVRPSSKKGRENGYCLWTSVCSYDVTAAFSSIDFFLTFLAASRSVAFLLIFVRSAEDED